jgi:hypothetical protein
MMVQRNIGQARARQANSHPLREERMARARYKLPNVFVGCPYAGKFNFPDFKHALDRIPFRWYYADTGLATKHLLGILRSYIKSVDYCVFDISTWNPNVALEIGLADGLGVDYYILLNRQLKENVPADIQGLQRIEYSSVTSFDSDGLIPQIVKYLVREHTHPRNIYQVLTGQNRTKQYLFALEVLAYLRDNARLPHTEIRRLCPGSYLRDGDRRMVLEKMADLRLLSNLSSSRGPALSKNLFPELLKVG